MQDLNKILSSQWKKSQRPVLAVKQRQDFKMKIEKSLNRDGITAKNSSVYLLIVRENSI